MKTLTRCVSGWITWGLVIAVAGGVSLAAQGAGLTVHGLKCESRINPLGIDAAQPRLSWWLESKARGQSQSAYRILAASSPDLLARERPDLWDTGQVHSDQSIQIDYRGAALRSGQRVYWKVRVWDEQHRASRWSETAWFEAGLLSATDWQASWIARPRARQLTDAELFGDDPAPLLRKEFTVSKPVRRARVYVSGLGYYELHLNGGRVGDHELDPGWTTYSRRVLYSSYDVTAQLKKGANALGVMLGNGWYNPLPMRMWGQFNLREALTVGEPRLILQLEMEYADGSIERVVTDESWRAGSGPIVRNSVYLGEVYDARREQAGWDSAGYNDSSWSKAVRATDALGALRAQDAPPIRITCRLNPVKLTEPKPGVFIFDLGQNFAGWATLKVQGPAGTRVKLRYGELLYADGTLNGMTAVCGQIKGGGRNYRYDGVGVPKTAFQEDEYILKGQGIETYTPRFTFHGFRYVEVTGFPGRPGQDSLQGLRLNSDVAPSGSFACSNELFNRIQKMVWWTELSNLFSVESDCPHREKFGYGGDIVAASEMAILNFDMARFYAKAVDDLVDAVRPNGGFTETAPFVGIASDGLGEKAGPIGWGTAEPVLLWELYRYYGDRRLLEQNYEVTRRWVDFLKTCAVDNLLDNGISDHESLAPKSRALTGTGFYYLNAKRFSQIAKVLGKQADAESAAALAERIQAAFNGKFLHSETGRYDIGSQACQAFALYLGLAPKAERSRVVAALVQDIQVNQQNHVTTGIFGTKFMLDALTDAGRADVAYALVNQRTFPGWGHMLANGATTLWEHWEYSDNVFSHNHPMFGSVSEWFYKALAGIEPASEAVGFDQIQIKPQVVADLGWVKAGYDSVRGKVQSEWERTGKQFKLRVRVPVGARATVFVPATELAAVRETGRRLGEAPGVELLRFEDTCAVVRVGSGQYEFSSVLP